MQRIDVGARLGAAAVAATIILVVAASFAGCVYLQCRRRLKLRRLLLLLMRIDKTDTTLATHRRRHVRRLVVEALRWRSVLVDLRAEVDDVSVAGGRCAHATRTAAAAASLDAAIDGAHRHGHHGLAQVVQVVEQLEVLAPVDHVCVELEAADEEAEYGHDDVLDEARAIPAVHDIVAAARIYHVRAILVQKVVATAVHSLSL